MRKIRIHSSDEAQRQEIERAVSLHSLDRRKVYCVYDGVLATHERCTTHCSGCRCDCGDDFPCAHGNAGCAECGYTGKRVIYFAAPVDGLILVNLVTP